jgi:hypothetical protein
MPPKKSAQQHADEAIAMIRSLGIFGNPDDDVSPAKAKQMIGSAKHKSRKYREEAKKDVAHAKTSAVSRVKKPENAWIKHVKAYHASHGGTYADALKEAKATYKR